MTTSRPLIARGERAPDFALPRGEGGETTRFYGLVGGRPVVLVLAADRDGATIADLVARLRTTCGEDLDVHVVAHTPAGSVDGTFRDPDKQVHEVYGALDDGPIAVVLDPNLRVAATAVIRDVDTALATIVEALEGLRATDETAAPVLFVPNALTGSLRDELMDRWWTQGSVETGVETVVDGARAEETDVRRKRRRDHTVTDPQLLRRLTQHVGARVFPELQKAFAFQAGGFEGFKIGCYSGEDRGHFEAHRDNLSAGTAHRRFGLTLNLNDDYTGGELRFPEYGHARYRPAAGEALVFSGAHLHEVLPVEHGRRFVLLSFVLARG